jgi:glycosyltransferase involved in cell wall biosynthesis
MNVCMVAYTFYESDNRVRRYAESLAQRGDRVDAFALQRPGQPAYEVLRGVHVYRIQKRVINEGGPFSYLIKLLLFFIRSAILLAKRHLAAPYQLIHVHSVPDFQVFAALVPRLAGAKVILDIHDIVPEFYASKFNVPERSLVFRMLLLVERLSIAFSHHVIIANHLWYEKLVRRSVKPEKCTAMINYPDLSIFYRRSAQSDYAGRFVLCYPGTLNWHQGLDVAVRAMAIVRQQVPNALLLIIGDGPERKKLGQLIHDGDLEDVVTLCGLVSIERVAEIMASVDLGVVPKRSDSFGNEAFSTKIMEFMAMGVPVLASETRVDQYYFSDGLVCFFKSSDPEDMASKIVELAREKARRDALRSRAEAFIGENSWDVKKQLYFELVDRLVGRNARTSESPVAQPLSS